MHKKMPKLRLQKNKKEWSFQKGATLLLHGVQAYIWKHQETLKTAFIPLARVRFQSLHRQTTFF